MRVNEFRKIKEGQIAKLKGKGPFLLWGGKGVLSPIDGL